MEVININNIEKGINNFLNGDEFDFKPYTLEKFVNQFILFGALIRLWYPETQKCGYKLLNKNDEYNICIDQEIKEDKCWQSEYKNHLVLGIVNFEDSGYSNIIDIVISPSTYDYEASKNRLVKENDFIRVKEKYAFEIPPNLHYGHCVEVDGDMIKINWDRRYGHDSSVWVERKKYEVVRK